MLVIYWKASTNISGKILIHSDLCDLDNGTLKFNYCCISGLSNYTRLSRKLLGLF